MGTFGFKRVAEQMAREILEGHALGRLVGGIGTGVEFHTFEGMACGYEGAYVLQFPALLAIAQEHMGIATLPKAPGVLAVMTNQAPTDKGLFRLDDKVAIVTAPPAASAPPRPRRWPRQGALIAAADINLDGLRPVVDGLPAGSKAYGWTFRASPICVPSSNT